MCFQDQSIQKNDLILINIYLWCRISTGIEDIADLLDDLKTVLDNAMLELGINPVSDPSPLEALQTLPTTAQSPREKALLQHIEKLEAALQNVPRR